MSQEDAMNMSNEQAIQILKPFRDMMIDQHGCPISDAVFALDKAIEALSVQPEQRWIPCSEMMPVSDGIYIVDDYRHGKHWIHTVGYMKRSNSWCEQHGIYYDDKYGRYDKQEDIIAWMPLPEPYREEGEE